MRIEMRLKCYLVIQSVVIGNRPLLFCIKYLQIDSSQPTGRRPYAICKKAITNWSFLTDWSVFTLDRPDFCKRSECVEYLDIKYPIYQLWRVIGWEVGGWVVHLDYSVSSGPFLRFTMSLSFSLTCLTTQYVRPGTQA